MRSLVAGLLLVAGCGGGAEGAPGGRAATPEIEALCAAPLVTYDFNTGGVVSSTPCHAFADFVAACDAAAESDSGDTLQARCFYLAADGGRVLTSDSPLPAIESRTCRGIDSVPSPSTVAACCCY